MAAKTMPTSALDQIESALGSLSTDDGPVAMDEVSIADPDAIIASFPTLVAEYKAAISADEKRSKAYAAIADLVMANRALTIRTDTGVPDWSGQTGFSKAFSRKVKLAVFTDKVSEERQRAISRGIENQLERGVREAAIVAHVLADDQTLGTGIVEKTGLPTPAMKKAVKRQYDGQGVIESGKKKGTARLKLPVTYGGAKKTGSGGGTDGDTPSLSQQLEDLVVIATTRDADGPTIAPLVRFTALWRLLSDEARFAVAHPDLEGYADRDKCKAIADSIAELAMIFSDAVSGKKADEAVQSALAANVWQDQS